MPPEHGANSPGCAGQGGLDALAGLPELVVKKGLSLGGLTEAERLAVLGLVWMGLPRETLSERQVNQALKAQLGGAVRCLDTDHVELRRWLCDAGWLLRDGFGREYRRTACAALPQRLRPLGATLEGAFAGGDTAGYTEARCAAHAAQRAARRRAHEAVRPSGL